MTLTTRWWLFGALLPTGVVALALFAVDGLFHFALLRSMDQGLLAQAAVESVSLFDGPNQQPHLHMTSSPLVESVRPFAPEGTLFGPDGRAVVHYPPRPEGTDDERLSPGTVGPPEISTEQVQLAPRRVLRVTVHAPDGRPYLLRLSASLEQLLEATETFHRVGLAIVALSVVLLLGLQTWQARRLSSRLLRLRRHLEAVQQGELDRAPPADPGTDEISQLREVLAAATRTLEQARATQERLVADAAHELRTPLTLMRTSLDLALRRERSPKELRDALKEVRDEVDRLTSLSTQLLDAAALKRGAQVRTPGDLGLLIRAAAAAVAGDAAERRVTLELQLPEAAPVAMHATSLRQALDNLLANALRHAPKDSVVTVALRREGEWWRSSVRDRGRGVPAAEREAVFEPFHRLPESGTGTGLGLTIVREVVARHGGRVTFVECAAPGAEVVLELPASPPALANPG